MQQSILIRIVVLAIAVPSLAQNAVKSDKEMFVIPTLTVSGHGEAFAAPDRATVRLGAVAQSADAASAQNQVNKVVSAAIESIKGLGIADAAIKTEGLSLSPVYAN